MSDATHFDADWLALREAVDARSRAAQLNDALTAWLRSHHQSESAPVSILDLGSGSGSNLRYLAPRLPVAQHWTLLDQDAALLALAARQRPRLDGALELTTRQADMGRWQDNPGEADAWLAETELVTASALLDLMSRAWVEALADAAARHGVAVLVALSVDGDWRLEDTASADGTISATHQQEDDWVRQHYRAHQATAKGVGAALGGEGSACLAAALEARGYQVHIASSPWLLRSPADRALGESLLAGWCRAVCEQRPASRDWLDAWHAERLTRWQRGELRIHVGHRDLLALPAMTG